MNYCLIIPTLGRKSVLKSIESALKQSIKPKQIVVVLNSNNNGSFILDKYKREIELFVNEIPGASNARNLGMEKLNENIDIVAFLDDDDTWLENKMELQIEFIRNNNLNKEDYWVVSSGAQVIYPNGQILKRPKKWYETSKSLSRQLYQFSWKRSSVYLPTPSWIVSRKVALELKFDSNLHNREDISFLLDIESKNGRIYQVNKYLCTVMSDRSRNASRENLKDYFLWIIKLSKTNFMSALAFATGTGFKTIASSFIQQIMYWLKIFTSK